MTTGRPEVTDIVPVGNRKPEEIIEIAAVIETRSQHPLADAILRYVKDKNIQIREGADFESITGKGAKTNIDGKSFYIGNPRLFDEMGAKLQTHLNEIERLQKEGKTVMLVGNSETLRVGSSSRCGQGNKCPSRKEIKRSRYQKNNYAHR